MSSTDDGLQPERTLLAWRRTALGLIANGVLVLASATGLGIAIIALALLIWTAVNVVYRNAEDRLTSLSGQRLLPATAYLVLTVGVFDLYTVLYH